MSERRMERLTLPRARAEPSGVEQPIPEARFPLPRWQTVPLDAKFPVVPAPKGEVTFVTNKLGQSRYISDQTTDFDLSDPYNRGINTEYNALFDPYLKGWFAKPNIRKHMQQNGLLTERGNVPVSVRDFNEYRLYLRKQAIMKEGNDVVVAQRREEKAKERKQALLTKTKMKAEVFGLEVKYKSLRAHQAHLEQEEEKRNRLLQKSASDDQRQRKRLAEEEKRYSQVLKERQAVWFKKQDRIKEREQAVRERSEMKLMKFELEVQDKLNKLDFLREQRFQILDQKRKKKWRDRRIYQQMEIEEAKKQRQRVEAEMRTIKRRYENQIARQAAKQEAILDLAKESRQKKKEQESETYARRMAQVLKHTRYTSLSGDQAGYLGGMSERSSIERPANVADVALTRKASIWMVQEILNRLGLSEESWRLRTQGVNYAYVADLDAAISSAVRKLEGLTVLGEEQEMLSRLIHLVWRAVKTAYPLQQVKLKARRRSDGTVPQEEEDAVEAQKEAERSIMENKMEDELTTGEQLSWYFPDDDDDEQVEQAVKISMLIKGDMERSMPMATPLGDRRPTAAHAQKLVDEKMDDFFKSRMRMTETDALAVEEELLHFLDSLKMNEATPDERRRILDMCIRLANHDVIKKSDPCGDLETNPEGLVFLAFGETDETKSETAMTRNASLAGTTRDPSLQGQRGSSIMTSKLEVAQTRDSGSAMSGKEAAITEEVEPVDESAAAPADSAIAGEGEAEPEAPVAEEITADADGEENVTENANTRKGNKNLNKNLNNAKPASGSSSSTTTTTTSSSSSSCSSSVSSASGSRETKDDCVDGGKEEHRQDHDERRNLRKSLHDDYERTESDGLSSTDGTRKDEDELDSASSGSDLSTSTSARRSKGCSGEGEQVIIDDLTENPNVNENKGQPTSERLSQARNISRNMMDDDQPPPAEDETEAEAEAQQSEEAEDKTQAEDMEEPLEDTLDNVEDGEDPEEVADSEDGQTEPAEHQKKDGADKTISLSDRLMAAQSSAMTGANSAQYGGFPSISETQENDPEVMEEIAFEEAAEADDIVAVAEQMLSKIQTREKTKGVSIPQSRLLRFVAMNLSRLWQPGPDEQFHQFGPWLRDPTTPETVRSLIYNIKRRRFPEELQMTLAKSIVSVCLDGVIEPDTPLTDGLVRIVLERFITDLEKDQVRIPVLEKVLQSVLQEYADFLRSNLEFNSSALLLDCIGYVYDMVIEGRITKNDHLIPAVRNWDHLPLDTRDSLHCGNWPNMLHRAGVAIRLDFTTSQDRKRLLDLLKAVCSERLEYDAVQDLKESLELARNRCTLSKFKRPFAIELAANTVAILLNTMNRNNILSTTLLPGVLNTSQSACTATSASVLGPYSTGEAVIVLALDKLASDLGSNELKPGTQAQIASSLMDLLVTRYGHRKEELGGEGLSAAFDDVSDQLDSFSLGYRDVKQFVAAILRPYLTDLIKPLLKEPLASAVSADATGQAPALSESQTRSLLALITQVFLSFIRSLALRLKQGGVNMELYSKRILGLYTWRSIAHLAKQAAVVLSDAQDDLRDEKLRNRVKASDSLIIERICRTVVDVNENGTVANVISGQSSQRSTFVEPASESDTVSSGFLHALLEANAKPGFIPVVDQFNPSRIRNKPGSRLLKLRQSFHSKQRFSTGGDPDDTLTEAEQRREATPGHIDRALRKEIIAAARDVGEFLVSNKALRQLTAKTADSFAGMVFVVEKLMEILNDKLWSIYIKLQRGKMTPDSVVSALINHQDCEDLPHLSMEKLAAVKVLKEAILELEGQHASAITMSRLVESLSRAAQGLVPGSDQASAQLRRQPHPILASASPVLLAQWVRSCLLSALRAVTIVLSGGKHSSAMKASVPVSKDMEKAVSGSIASQETTGHRKVAKREIDLDAIHLAASYAVVHNLLAQVRNTTEREKSPDNLWLMNRVAGTQERSQVGVPCEILDRVFARLAGVMETLADTVGESPEDNDGRAPEKAYDVASVIINQVTSAVSYHVEVGRFPPVSVNDLLNSVRPAGGKTAPSSRPAAQPEASQKGQPSNDRKDSNVSKNNRQLDGDLTNWSLNNSFAVTLQDPVSKMQGRWSSYLFHGLMDIVGRLDNTLREAVDESMGLRDPVTTDARVRARAFTSATLDKIKKHAISQEVLLYNGQAKSNSVANIKVANGMVPTPPLLPKRSSQTSVNVRRAKYASGNSNANKMCGRGGNLHKDSRTKDSTNNLVAATSAEGKNTSLVVYLRSLLRPISDTNYGDIFSRSLGGGGGNVSNNKSVDVVAEVLRAAYLVSLDLFHEFELPGKPGPTEESAGQQRDPIDKAISALLLDLLLANLNSSLEKHCRTVHGIASSSSLQMRSGDYGKSGFVPEDSPYVSSYQYRTPDPYGPFYAEVVDRGRRWCQMVDVDAAPSACSGRRGAVDVARIHSLTRALLKPQIKDHQGESQHHVIGQDLTSTMVSGTQSGSSQPSASSSLQDKPAKVTKEGSGRHYQDGERRSAAWRKEVHKLSARYAVDNTNNSWRKRSQTQAQDQKKNIKPTRSAATTLVNKATPARNLAPRATRHKSVEQPSKLSTGTDRTTRTKSFTSSVSETKDPRAAKESPNVTKQPSTKRQTSGTISGVHTRASRGNSVDAKITEPRPRPFRIAKGACANVLSRGRPKAKAGLEPKDAKTHQEPNSVEKSGESTKETMKFWDLNAEQPQPARADGPRGDPEGQGHEFQWQEPRVQVFYHVPEQEVAEAEKQLKQYRQTESEISEMDTLSNLDVQLLMLALLRRDLPKETSILAACLRGQGRLKLSGLEIVADLLSLLDNVLEDLDGVAAPLDQPEGQVAGSKGVERQSPDQKDKAKEIDDAKVMAKVKRLLKVSSKKLEVSQRSAGAVHSLLRSLEYGLLSDDAIQAGLGSCTSKVANKSEQQSINIPAVKLQMKSSLAQLVERLEEGHAPTDMTSSDWTRLATEIVHQQHQQQTQDQHQNQEYLELHQSPSHCSKDDEGDDETQMTDYDEMHSFEYFDHDQEHSEDLQEQGVKADQGGKSNESSPGRRRVSEKPGPRSASSSPRQSRSRSSSRSRSGSRLAYRFTSRSPQRRSGRSSVSGGSAHGSEEGAKRRHSGKRRTARSWSPGRQHSARSSSMSRSSVTSMSSASSSSTSCCSAASKESRCSDRACSVASRGKAGHAQSLGELENGRHSAVSRSSSDQRSKSS